MRRHLIESVCAALLVCSLVGVPACEEETTQARSGPRDLPLITAARQNDIDAIAEALDAGASINALDHDGYGALHWVAKLGHLEACRFLLENGANPNVRLDEHDDHLMRERGPTPLIVAIEQRNLAIAELLLKSGAEPNVTHNKLQSSPLTIAVRSGSLPAVQLLLEYGADPASSPPTSKLAELINPPKQDDDPDSFLPDALELAVELGHLEIAQILADNEKWKDESLLVVAVAHGHRPIVEWLLDSGVNVDYVYERYYLPIARPSGERREASLSSGNCNALRAALAFRDHSLMKLLLERGADPDSVLFATCRIGDEEALRLLIAFGADLSAQTEEGLTPVQVAAEHGHRQCVAVLNSAG